MNLDGLIKHIDRADQRRGRSLLRNMVAGRAIRSSDMGVVVTVDRLSRKALRDVTVSDLVRMGIVKAVS
ncbi:hypothetical protein O1W71_16390 [Microbacterium sp. H37-C3]|uniref:hypothetical protein n=1 Tax=Microbacterium sp. H37-C3 TaxID=3004354 RepID=UPI0022AF7669|nr:hypothetical protein [Microbacterium sp. H37-C3]MCZ4069250.1 hypothetical protein [Microbacterium sp. H37-C3]